MVRADAAADGGGAGADPGDLPDARGRVRPVRGAPRGATARGQRPRQPPRRQVGAPPPRPHRRLLPRQPQPACASRRRVRGRAGGEVERHGGGRGQRRGGGGRRGVVPGGDAGGHHAHHLRQQLRRRPRRLLHAGPAHGLRLRGVPQGARPRLPVLPDQEELAVVEARLGDPAAPDEAHQPAQRRGGRGAGPGREERLPRPAQPHDQCRRTTDDAGVAVAAAGDSGGGDAGGVQDLLLRREADDHHAPDVGHRAPRHAPRVAGARAAGGPRGLRRRRAPHQGAPAQAQNARHDHQRDAPTVPAGGGHDPPREDGRPALRRHHDPARHGAAHPHHGAAPRREVLGPRRGAVQPGEVRRRRGEGGEAPAGVHPVRAGGADVHRPEPRAPRGQARHGRPPAAVPHPDVAQVRARADGAHAALPAVRSAVDLPAAIARRPD